MIEDLHRSQSDFGSFKDALGQRIKEAIDNYHEGSLLPYSNLCGTVPNVTQSKINEMTS
jgi:hypothetical protein